MSYSRGVQSSSSKVTTMHVVEVFLFQQTWFEWMGDQASAGLVCFIIFIFFYLLLFIIYIYYNYVYLLYCFIDTDVFV